MIFILFLSLVPVTTSFAGNHHVDSFAVSLLFINYFLMNLLFGSLYWYANMKGLLSDEFMADNKATGKFSIIGIMGLVIAIPLAYLSTYLSFGLGIIIFTGHLFKRK